MGVYNDNRHTNRLSWEYSYTGAELLEAARKKHDEFAAKEKEAREKMATFMVDMSMAQSDARIADCRSDVEEAGSERERCMVWIHEFSRNPQKEYSLELGDITYFDLALEAK